MSGYLIPDLIYYDTGRECEGNVRIINGMKKRHIHFANMRMVQGFCIPVVVACACIGWLIFETLLTCGCFKEVFFE